jgi:hypothetical protein
MKTKKDFTALLEESLTEMLAVERGKVQPTRRILLESSTAPAQSTPTTVRATQVHP